MNWKNYPLLFGLLGAFLLNDVPTSAQPSVTDLQQYFNTIRQAPYQPLPASALTDTQNGDALIDVAIPYCNDSTELVRSGAYYALYHGRTGDEVEISYDSRAVILARIRAKVKNPDFHAKLDELDLDEGALKRLDEDIGEAGMVDAFERTPNLVEAWKHLDDAGLTALRKDPNWLNRVKGWADDGLSLTSEGKILNNGSEVGKIIGDRLHVKYSGHGGDIVCDPDKTTTILGKWKDPSCGGTCEVIDSRLSKSGQNTGGVNVLGENIPSGWTDQQIWDNVNEPWLRDAASRGDVIRVVSDPTLPANIYKPDGSLSFFGREHELLTKPVSQGGLGYTYNPSTFSYVK